MSEAEARDRTADILDRLDNFHENFDAFYNEPVPLLASQLCADAADEIRRLKSEIERIGRAASTTKEG